MVTPLDAFGIVSNAISIASALQGWIDGAGSDPGASFRQSVGNKLDAIQNQLQTVITGLDYLTALAKWNNATTSLSAAKLNIDNAWVGADMDQFIGGSDSGANMPTFEASTVSNLVSALETYHNYILGNEGGINTPTGTSTPLLQSYLDMVYAIPPDQQLPASPCEMAYHYWRTLVYDQLKALAMLAIASQQGIVDKTTQSTVSNWTVATRSDNYFSLQGEACQKVATSQVTGPASVATYANIKRFCSAVPCPTSSVSGGEYALDQFEQNQMPPGTGPSYFLLADVSGSEAQPCIPDNEVLVSWGIEARQIQYFDLDSAYQYPAYLLLPVFYSGKFDQTTGLVSPPPELQSFRETRFPNFTAEDQMIHAAVQQAPDNTNQQYTQEYYWYLGYVGTVTPGEGQQPDIPDGQFLTGITFEKPPQQGKLYNGWVNNIEYWRITNRLFIKVQAASLGSDGTTAAPQWVGNQRGVEHLNHLPIDDPNNWDRLLPASRVTSRCVGADSVNTAYGDALSKGTPMPPLTGAGIDFYHDVANVISPLNIYAYHLNKFNS